MGTFSYHNYLPFEKKAQPLFWTVSRRNGTVSLATPIIEWTRRNTALTQKFIDSLNQKKIAREEYGSSVLFVCRSRRLNGTVLRMRAQKPRSRATKIGSLPTQWPQAPSKGLKFAALYSWVILTPLFHWFFFFRALR